MTRSSIPERLVQRLDDLGALLAGRGDAIALIGLGSVGLDLDRLDDHSDLDFFVIVEDGARQRYLDSVDWLEELSPVAFSFPNTLDGRKVLFADRLYAEYAVFTLDGVAACAAPPAGLSGGAQMLPTIARRHWPFSPGSRRTPTSTRRSQRRSASSAMSFPAGAGLIPRVDGGS